MSQQPQTYDFINGFETPEEADVARLKLLHADKYAIFGIHIANGNNVKSLYCWIPKRAAKIIFNNEVDES